MKLKEFLLMFKKSLNPFKYGELMHFKKRTVAMYLFYLLFLAILLNGILNIPKLGYLPEKIDRSLSKFSKFSIIGLDIDASEPFIILKEPKIVLDFRAEPEAHDAYIVVTKHELYIKRFSPDVFDLRLYNTTKIPMENYADLLDDLNRAKGKIWIVLFFMLPSIFFFVYVLNLLKYTMIFFMAYSLGIIYLLVRHKEINIESLFKTTMFSLGIMVFLDVGLAPLIDLGLIPVLIFTIYFFISIRTKTSKKKKDDNDGYVDLN